MTDVAREQHLIYERGNSLAKRAMKDASKRANANISYGAYQDAAVVLETTAKGGH